MKLLLKTQVNANYKTVMNGFDLELFKALKPPLMSLLVERFDGCKVGDEVHLKVGIGLMYKEWVSLITDYQESEDQIYFTDEGKVLPFPLKSWKHNHRVIKLGPHKSEIQDDIEYSSGNRILDICMYPVLYLQFACRIPVYKKVFSKEDL
jgi:ligand-binding SRPBCC domain-containing protein